MARASTRSLIHTASFPVGGVLGSAAGAALVSGSFWGVAAGLMTLVGVVIVWATAWRVATTRLDDAAAALEPNASASLPNTGYATFVGAWWAVALDPRIQQRDELTRAITVASVLTAAPVFFATAFLASVLVWLRSA